MELKKVVICRAAGLAGWVAECQYEDRNLLDLDIQHQDLPAAIEMAEDNYPDDIEVTIEADTFWTNRYNDYLQEKFGRIDFSH